MASPSMTVARMLFLSEARRRWRSYVGLAAVIGLCGSVSFAAIGGARRTVSTFDRHLAASKASQLNINANPYGPSTVDAMRALPGVVSVQSFAGLLMARSDEQKAAPLPDTGMEEIVASLDGMFLDQDQVVLVAGEMPGAGDAGRVLVNRTIAQRLNLEPGQTMHFVAANPKTFELLRGFTVTIAGVGITSQEVAADDVDHMGRVIFTPQFLRENPDLLFGPEGDDPTYVWSGLRLAGGVSPADVKAGWERSSAGPKSEDAGSFYRETDDLRAKVQRSVRPQVVALASFGALAALVSLLLIGQATRRVVRPSSQEADVLRALGSTRAGAGTASLVAATVAAVAGGLLAIAGSAALSVLTPVGVVRPIEPDPGSNVDLMVVGPGLAVLLASVAGAAAWSSMRTLRTLKPLRPHHRLQRTALPVPVRVGIEFLVDQRSGIGRSAIASAVVATVALVATLTMSQSMQHLTTTPRLYGNDFDVAVQMGAGYGGVDGERIGRVLDAFPEVTGWSTVLYSQIPVDGRVVPLVALRRGRTTAQPTLITGRSPSRGEVVLGRDTLESLGKQVGDSVDVGGASLDVVGSAAFPAAGPAFADHPVLGLGIWMDGQEHDELASQSADTNTNGIFLRTRPGTDADTVVRAIQEKYVEAGGEIAEDEGLEPFTTLRPAEIAGLKGMATVPLAFTSVLALGALAALALALVAAVQRGRHDLALLKTFGFTKGQTYATIASEATATVLLGGLIGIPCGLALGRLLWSLFATDLGAVVETRTPLLLVLAAGVAGLAAANLVALAPGRAAATSRPAEVLRRD